MNTYMTRQVTNGCYPNFPLNSIHLSAKEDKDSLNKQKRNSSANYAAGLPCEANQASDASTRLFRLLPFLKRFLQNSKYTSVCRNQGDIYKHFVETVSGLMSVSKKGLNLASLCL